MASDSASCAKPMLQDLTVGFIGCGDLGKAILKGILHKASSSPPALESWVGVEYFASVQSETSAQALREVFAADAAPRGSVYFEILKRQNVEVAKESDLIILACPPATVKVVLSEQGMAHALANKPLISLAAGVTITQMEDALYHGAGDNSDSQDQKRCCIVRAMPNIAASLGASATGISFPTNPAPPKKTIDLVDSFFLCVGGITHIPESQMDAVSVVCGASPAFMALFCDAIIDGAVAGGLPRAQAESMTAQAMASTAALLAANGGGKKPSEVRENVCANPGITIGGILDLEKGGVRGCISGAVRDSILAARSLG